MYEILPLKRKLQETIRDLPPGPKGKLTEAFRDIERNPFYHPTGKIGAFKGNLAHLGYHYRLPNGHRIHYTVDVQTKTVTITYIGPHPSNY